jgi:hypothetical protein
MRVTCHPTLKCFNEDEALLLLAGERLSMLTEADHLVAAYIVRELGCHPLAVAVAGSYLAKGFTTDAEYLSALADPKKDAVEFGSELKEILPTGHERSIRATLSKSVGILGEDGLAFLELASVLAAAPIPFSLVEAAILEKDRRGPVRWLARTVWALLRSRWSRDERLGTNGSGTV